jgi:hypothetical protein
MTVDDAITFATGSLLLVFIGCYAILALIVGCDVVSTRRRVRRLKAQAKGDRDGL